MNLHENSGDHRQQLVEARQSKGRKMSSGQSSASIGESIGKCIRCFEAQDVETPEELLGGDVVIKGTVLLSKKYLIDFADLSSNFVDNALDLMGRKVTFQLVSVDLDPREYNTKLLLFL